MHISSNPVNPELRGRLTLVAEGEVSSPALSGDGSTVVWNEMVDDQLDIMRYDAGSGETVNLTHDRHPDMHADVNRDGSVIVWTRFSREDPRDNTGSWDVYQWRNGEISAVAEAPAHEMDPAVSADGTTVAYNEDGQSNYGIWNIHRVKDGQDEALTSGRGWNAWPVVSEDGGRVLWRQLRSGGSDIWLRDEAGTVKPAVIGANHCVQPTMTPDGEKVAWTHSNKESGVKALHMLNLATGEHSVFADTEETTEGDVDLSADGRKGVWTNFDFRKGRPADTQIYYKNGDEALPLTHDSAGMSYSPRISEDGRVVVWTWHNHDDIRDRRIYRFELEQ